MPGTAVDLVDGGRPQPLERAEVRSSALRRVSPEARDRRRATDVVIAFERFCRWKVIANRCASSRTRCSR